MEHIKLVILTLLACALQSDLIGQGIEFLDCPADDITLCAPDSRLVLPDNNQIILGEGHPDASACSAHLRIQQQVESDCGIILRYFVDYYANDTGDKIRIQDTSEAFVDAAQVAQLTLDTKLFGTPEIILNGLDYNQSCPTDPGGFHRLEWTVINECDEVVTCTYLVRLEDCMGPVAEPEDVTTIVFPVNQQVTIAAQELVEFAVDDCSPVNWLLYSFSESVFRPIKMVNCDSIAENGGPLFEIDVWVADAGVDRNCDGQITWDERASTKISALVIMEDDCMGEIFDGTILSENLVPVPDVTVSFHGGPMVLTAVTDEDGEYRLPQLVDSTESYTIIPVRTDGVADGISTLDLVKIQKHLLGIEFLDSPYKMIAADANNNRDISVVDLLELRKLILRITETLPNNNSWRFVAADHVFSDPDNPWTFPEFSDLDELDFVGIKIGDVNGTVTQPPSHSPARLAKLSVKDISVQSGNAYSIPVLASSQMSTLGLQFTMATDDLRVTNVRPGALSMGATDIAVHKSNITASWFDAVATQVEAGDVLFYVDIEVTATGSLSQFFSFSSILTAAEIYLEEMGGDEALQLELEFEKAEDKPMAMTVFPNPTIGDCTVEYHGVRGDMASVVVYDIEGRELMSQKRECVDGINRITLTTSDLPGPGVYQVVVRTSEQSETARLVITGR